MGPSRERTAQEQWHTVSATRRSQAGRHHPFNDNVLGVGAPRTTMNPLAPSRTDGYPERVGDFTSGRLGDMGPWR